MPEEFVNCIDTKTGTPRRFPKRITNDPWFKNSKWEVAEPETKISKKTSVDEESKSKVEIPKEITEDNLPENGQLKEEDQFVSVDGQNISEKSHSGDSDEMTELRETHKEVFGKYPHPKISIEKLREKINGN